MKKKANKKKVPDPRYGVIRSMYKDGAIHSLIDIFKYVPITIVAGDLHIKVAKLRALLDNPEDFTIEQFYKIGSLCGLAEREIWLLTETCRLQKEEEKRKKIENVKALIKNLG